MNLRPSLVVAIIAAGAAAAALDFAATARASSLVFVKRSDGNVWLAAADGAEQLQVTTDGSRIAPYFSPSQSESGTIEVARGTGPAGRIYRLNRVGSRLSARFAVPQAPVISDPVISPDGRKVAFWTASNADVTAPCYTNFYCFEVSYSARYNQLVRPAWMTFQHPAWIGSSRLLLFNDSGTLSYADLGGHGFKPWFSWPDYHPPAADGSGEWSQGAASTDGRQLALVAHEDDLRRFVVQLFVAAADMRSADLSTYRPAPRSCALNAPDGGTGADPRHPGSSAFHSLSFSPYGTALAYGFKGAVYVASLASCTSNKVIAGADDPFWGSRNVAAPRLSISPPGVTTIGRLLRGLRLTVTLNAPGKVALELTEGRHTLAHALVKLAARHPRAVVLRPTGAFARRLKGLKTLHATLRASVVGFRRTAQRMRIVAGTP